MFDILFRNAKVIDGTGNPWFYGDVGVEGGTVAAVLPPGSTARARRVADVDGKARCPGFVDGHSHSELPLLAGEGMDCKIMQGVTTENLGLDGMSLAPIKDGDKADWKKHLSGLAGTLDVPWTWNSFAEYLDCLQAAKPPLNVSSDVGLGAVRLSVMGMADRPAEDHEIRAMRDLVARCMDEGARGISAGLIYPPSRYQSLEETVAVAKAAAAHGGGPLRGPCGVHGRQPGRTAACRWSLFQIVRSKPVGRTSFCLKCDAQLLCSSLQGGKVCVVVQNVIRLCGQLCFRRLGVETAAGHFRRDAVPCYDAGHTGFKGRCDHA